MSIEAVLFDKVRRSYPDAAHSGLWKKCPRCGRMGVVFHVPSYEGFVIAWEGTARGPEGTIDADTCLLTDLTDPLPGCGYDREGREASP